MPTPPQIKSHWRKLVDSFREASRNAKFPEYSDHAERSQNHRYYR